MSGRIFLANVGANASHRFAGPVFPDGTFEFLPIPEQPDPAGPHAVRYRDLVSFNDPGRGLTEYVPERLWARATHSDPEFETFTYGDNCEWSPRASGLKGMEHGDILFFLARLELWASGRPTGTFGFYLVGFLEIETVLRNVRSRPSQAQMARFGANAHVRRGLSDAALWDGFWVFAGSGRSRRFERAVPVDRGIATAAFTTAKGWPWRWDGGRTPLQVIGSYTRSCRCVIDPSQSGHRERAEALWERVEHYSGAVRPLR